MGKQPTLSINLIEAAYNVHAAWLMMTKDDKARREDIKLAMGDRNLYEVGPYVVTLFQHERHNIDRLAIRARYPAIAEEVTYLSQFWKLEIIKHQQEKG